MPESPKGGPPSTGPASAAAITPADAVQLTLCSRSLFDALIHLAQVADGALRQNPADLTAVRRAWERARDACDEFKARGGHQAVAATLHQWRKEQAGYHSRRVVRTVTERDAHGRPTRVLEEPFVEASQ